jgi:hypothetical protein
MERHFKVLKPRIGILLLLFISIAGIIFVNCSGPSSVSSKELETGFITPPASAKPRVWWHWMNGNVSKDGIKKDLLWMNRVGIAGFQNFDAGMTTPQVVDKRLVYMTPEWKDAFLFTTKLADSLNLEMAIAGSPGWSESGGPWVTPAEAMKKIVWSEIRIEGGKQYSGVLPKPPVTTGAFQNIALAGRTVINGERVPLPEFYADAAVVAYRAPEKDVAMSDLKPIITSSGGKFDLTQLTDGDLVKTVLLPAAKPTQKSWLQFEFDKPVTIQSITSVIGGGSGRGASGGPVLESSDDGKVFIKVLDITGGRVSQNTLTFSPVTAKIFRIAITAPAPAPAAPQGGANMMAGMFGGGAGGGAAAPAGAQIAEFVLHTVARVNHFEEKAAFSTATNLYTLPTPSIPAAEAVNKADVIDITSMMKPDGTLTWTPPAGNWIVMRLGYSLTGHQNSPASPEATGLEVDKLNKTYVTNYFTNYLGQYKDATGGLMGKKGLQYIITDSWEAGVQNWTDNIMVDFKSLRGYDMTPWLPVLTGHIVESAEASDKFLWDFRKTLSDLVTLNHYNVLTEMLHEIGMGRYTESHEGGRAFIGDGMEVKSKADVPMSATWTPGGFGGNEGGVATRFKADVRESASVSHIYGQNLVAAESMTAMGTAWAWSPELLKPTADMELASGLNRFVIHTSVHQPVDDKIPGLGLGPFGQWFTRHETWAEQAGPWMDYLARSSYMLQQGKFVADVIYYYGEDNNITALFGSKLPDVPAAYNYDFVNSDALVNVLEVKEGNITTASGMSYKVLALDQNARYMSLQVLNKISTMVNAGAIVIGNKPIGTPSLTDDETEFNRVADQLWSTEKGETVVGEGKVYSGQTIQEVLDLLKVAPDFNYTKPNENTNVLFVHRKIGDIDVYWVNNRNTYVEDIEATFRVDGKSAEIWHPETGKIEQASYSIADGLTTVPLHLESSDAVFVVFRNKSKKTSVIIPQLKETKLAAIDGSWNLSFQPNRGAPAQIVLPELTSWSENADPGVKYFSGTGTYTKTFQSTADWFNEGTQVWLDLGSVKNLAEVVVNGKSLGIIWKTPFRVNVTEALKEGENNLEVKVTNLWVNRLIGDQQPGVTAKITYTTQVFYQATAPLMTSGLLGPVQLVSITNN